MNLKYLSILLYVHAYSCSTTKWTIFEDIGLELFSYFKLRYSITGQQLPTYPNDNDKFFNKTSSELRAMCSLLRNSRIYQRELLQDVQTPPAPLQEMSENGDLDKFRYELRPLKTLLGNIYGEVPVFYCQTHENIKYWLTYGYRDDRIFLLQEVGDDSDAVAFVGMSEPTPEVNKKYPLGESLDDYFKEAVHSKLTLAENGVAREEERCTLNQRCFYREGTPNPVWLGIPKVNETAGTVLSSMTFRLCCLVHNARVNADPVKKSMVVNYVYGDLNSMVDSGKIKLHGPEKYGEAVPALGCVINGEVEFYLVADNEDSYAVFVLEETEEKEFIVVQHVHKLSFRSSSAICL